MENEEKREQGYDEIQEVEEIGVESNEESPTFRPKRSGGLSFVLILSMIGSGWNILAHFLSAVSVALMGTMVENNGGEIPEELMTMYSQMTSLEPQMITETINRFLEIPTYYYIFAAMLYIVSLVGVVMMWKMRKTGFHVYTLAQLLVLLITALLGKAYISMGDVMMTLLFVAFYAVNFFKKTDCVKE